MSMSKLSHLSHPFGADVPRTHAKAAILQPTRGKAVSAVAVNPGTLTRRQHFDASNGHANESSGALDHLATTPLTKPPQGKRLSAPAVSPGMRSRIGCDVLHSEQPGAAHARGSNPARHALMFELGQTVLDEAIRSGGKVS
jgi:hypothetical protein